MEINLSSLSEIKNPKELEINKSTFPLSEITKSSESKIYFNKSLELEMNKSTFPSPSSEKKYGKSSETKMISHHHQMIKKDVTKIGSK